MMKTIRFCERNTLQAMNDLTTQPFSCLRMHDGHCVFLSDSLKKWIDPKQYPEQYAAYQQAVLKQQGFFTFESDHQFLHMVLHTQTLRLEEQMVWFTSCSLVSAETKEAFDYLQQVNRKRTNDIPCGLFCVCMKEPVTLTYANSYLFHLFGYEKGEVDADFLLSETVISPQERKKLLAGVNARNIKGHDYYEIEYKAKHRDGHVMQLLLRFVQDALEDCYLGAAFDITLRKQVVERLRISEEEKRIILKQGNLVVLRYDIKTKVLMLTEEGKIPDEKYRRIENIPETAIQHHMISDETVQEYLDFYHHMQEGVPYGETIFKQYNARLKQYQWIKACYTLLFDEEQQPQTAVITYEDHTKLHEKELAYEKWKQNLELKQQESFAYYEYDMTNDRFEMLKGELSKNLPEEARGSFSSVAQYACEHFVYEKDRKQYRRIFSREYLLASFQKGKTRIHLQHRRYRKNQQVFWALAEIQLISDPFENVIRASVMMVDIDQEKKAAMQLKRLSETDPLTGLYNRRTFLKKIENTLKNTNHKSRHMLISLDLDHFKELNDHLGHHYGDKVLQEVSAKLLHQCRKEDSCARFGGDEFFIFLQNLPQDMDIQERLKQLLDSMHATYEKAYPISASIGVALYPKDGQDFTTLYECADAAMYEAKRNGRNQFCIYNKKEMTLK